MSQVSKNELVTYGYIRCHIHLIQIIPNEVKDLCYDYYGHFNEHIQFKPDNININYNEKNTIYCMTLIKNIFSGWSSCYGSFIIDSMDEHKYEWIFKINKMSSFCMIGLIHSKNDKNYVVNDHVGLNTIQHTWQTNSYSGGSLFGHHRYNKNSSRYGRSPHKMEDIIKMELNISKTSSYLKFYHNDQDLGKAFENIDLSTDKKYRLGISLGDKNDSISLLSFTVDGRK